jgi:hypothetical protein
MRRLASFSAVVLAAYLALAFALFCTAWQHPRGRWIGHDFDPVLFIWYLRWMPFALAHGHNPLVSDYLNYPGGFHLMWNTSILLPAFVLSPVTLLLGVVVAYNLLSTLALAFSAWCAYFALRRYVRPGAAAIGGLLYGFSSFMLVQATNHPHMTLAVFPPLALLLLDEVLVRQRRRPVVLGVLLGVAAGLQLVTGEEILATTVLVAAIGVALLALMHRDEVRRRAPYAARALGTAALLGLVLAAYPLARQSFGSHHLLATKGPVQGGGTYVLDAVELVVPSQRQELTFGAANRVATKFKGQSEIDGYIGLPLLLLVAFVVVTYRRDRLVQFAAALGGIVLLLALGPRANFAGHPLPIPLPWVVPQRLPLLQAILPARLALLLFLLLALLVAIFVDRSRLPKPALIAILVIAFVPLIPNLPFPSTADATPAFFDDGARAFPAGSVALVAPLASISGGTTRAMLWQARADLRFRMPEGVVIAPHGHRPPALDELADRLAAIGRGERAPPGYAAMRCALAEEGIDWVVVGPMSYGLERTVEFFQALLGRRPVDAGGVAYWSVGSGGSGCP